jgi:Fe-S oxidoreductase/FAD/FMN-containing dehydrogenase
MTKNMPADFISRLTLLLGERIRFNKVERLVYSHDMGVMPAQVVKMIDNMPDAVAQPISPEELSAIVKLAAEFQHPLVPRGSGTSGFGGALPVQGGIILDFVRMNKIISIDDKDLTVTVEPGVIWEDLHRYLQERSFSLRLYPSSAPSATVAGWVAQGGSGFGSYEYGPCKEALVAVSVILPDGSTRTFEHDELKFVYAMCGITGIISQVTLKIKPYEKEIPMAVAFATLNHAVQALQSIRRQGIPLWSVSMSTPDYIKLKQDVLHHQVLPADKYLLTLVYMQGMNNEHLNQLNQIVSDNNGQILPQATAEEEWNARFEPMRFKRLGPTLIASEVIIPLDKLVDFVSEIERRYKGHFALEGTMIQHDKMAVLGFMLSDERKLGYPMAFTNSLTVLEIGEKLGGTVPGFGLYFADKARDILGEKVVDEIWAYKNQIDPNGLFNPGKAMPGSLDQNSPKMLRTAMNLANKGKSMIGLVGRLVDIVQPDSFNSPLDDHLTHDAFACASCGYCRNECTVFNASPWESISPRGKYYLLSQFIKGNIELDEEVSRALFSCTTCKKCDEVCQIKAHNAHNWLSLRPCFHANGLENTGLAQIRENVLSTGNFWGVPAHEKFKWLDVPAQKTGKIGFWAGCWANVVMPNMAQNVTRILNKAGIDFVHFGEGESCCGLYLTLGGYMKDFTEQVKKNLQVFNEAGVDTVIFTCPGCYATFSEFYPAMAQQLGMECNIKFRHIVSFLSELVDRQKLGFEKELDYKLTYHDSCHVGRWFGHYDEPRNIIAAIPGVQLAEMEHNREKSLCCGLVAAFDSLPTAGHSGVKRITEAEKTGADFIVTNCAGCGSQFNATSCAMQTRVRQRDLSELVAEAMGLTVQDPTDNISHYMSQVAQLLQNSKLTRKKSNPQ